MNQISKLLTNDKIPAVVKPLLLNEYEELYLDKMKTRLYEGPASYCAKHRAAELDYDIASGLEEIATHPVDTYKLMDMRRKDKICSEDFSVAMEVHNMGMHKGLGYEGASVLTSMYMKMGLSNTLEQELLDFRQRSYQ